nr:nucleotidyltransferase domain-containing protein [Candidatus Njordarchaeum guaymaensis]
MSRLEAILERRDQRKRKLQSALDSIVSQLRKMGSMKVIVFGSLATGDVDVNSDVDLLAIMPGTRSGKEWSKLIYENVERGIASDIIVFNETEFEKELPLNSFLRQIVKSGKVVYEETSQR